MRYEDVIKDFARRTSVASEDAVGSLCGQSVLGRFSRIRGRHRSRVGRHCHGW